MIRKSFGIIVLAILSFAPKVFSQGHQLQLDDGFGAYSLIRGSSGGGTYTLPNPPGTLVTTGSLPGFAWALNGNNLAGVDGTNNLL